MSDNLRQQITTSLNLKETEELVDIWIRNNQAEWSDTAFEIIEAILEERLDELPPQNEATYERVQKGTDRRIDMHVESDQFTGFDNEPIFYQPKEVRWMGLWLNRMAIAVVIATVFIRLPGLFQTQSTILSYSSLTPAWNATAWLIAILLWGIAVAVECVILYFSLKALASILEILKEMELLSRSASK